MLRTRMRQTLSVVVAVVVVCSFVGAPVAAAATLDDESDSTLDGLDSDSRTSTDTTDGTADTADDTDGDADTGEDSDGDDDADTDDDTDEEDGTADDEASTDDDADADDENSSGDRSLRSDDSDDEDRERRTDRVRDAVNETDDAVENATEGLEDTSTDALDGGEDAVEGTVDQVLTYAELEESLGLDVLGVGALESDVGPTGGAYAYDRTVATDHRAPPLDAPSDGAAGSGPDATAAAASDSDGDGDGAGPANPAGATIGLGAIATAAALRGSSVVTGSRTARSSGLVSRLIEKVRPFLFPLRYSRYDDSDPLEHEARERVYEIVNETPGSYLSEVSQEADLPLSTTRHHIKVLEREDLLTGAKLHGKRRFYPAYAEGIELSAALNDESTASIIRTIARVGAASVSDLADELGRDPSTISHHLQRLEADGVITRERDGRAVVNKLSAEARTALEPETAPEPRDRGEIIAGGAD